MLNPAIEERFKVLPPYYQEFVGGDFAPKVALTFGGSTGLTDEQISSYEDLIILYLMFFIELEDVTKQLTEAGVDAMVAQSLTSSLEQSLPEFARQNEVEDEVPSTSTLNQEIVEAEKSLASLQGIRTMAGDMRAAEHEPEVLTHQSSQDALFQKTAPPSPPPTNTGPRWDTG